MRTAAKTSLSFVQKGRLPAPGTGPAWLCLLLEPAVFLVVVPCGEPSAGRSWCFDHAPSASHSLGARGFTVGHLNNLELEIPRQKTAFFCLTPSDCNCDRCLKSRQIYLYCLGPDPAKNGAVLKSDAHRLPHCQYFHRLSQVCLQKLCGMREMLCGLSVVFGELNMDSDWFGAGFSQKRLTLGYET